MMMTSKSHIWTLWRINRRESLSQVLLSVLIHALITTTGTFCCNRRSLVTELEEQSKSRDIWYRRRYQSEWLTLRVEGKRRWRRSLPKDTSIHRRFPESSLCLFYEEACHDHQDHHQKQEVRVPVHLYDDDVADVYQYKSLSDSMTLNRQSFPQVEDVYRNEMMPVNLTVSSFIPFPFFSISNQDKLQRRRDQFYWTWGMWWTCM